MNVEQLEPHIRSLFRCLLNKDTIIQRQMIERTYFEEARLQNPYLLLSNRDEIVRSYAGLSNSCTELFAIVESVEYDAATQTATVSILQTIKPKALGGVLAITTHQHLVLQLEHDDSITSPSRVLRIVDHTEKHTAQALLKQMPILGKYYDTHLRTAMGQIAMTGTSVLNATGLLDLVPAAVRVGTDTATAVRDRTANLASRVRGVAVPALEATGVTPLVRDVYGLTRSAAHWASVTTRDTAARIGEYGKQAAIAATSFSASGQAAVDCYSPTCAPGQACYSPTCPRGKTYAHLKEESVAAVVRQVYTGQDLGTDGEGGFLRPLA
ncbi:hypothetical protein HKX48_007136 [Thoreauomyces humboldtii]|nr:hypothetical protein HKX48_007136 [Thoreauomyces humboldtii]